MASLHLRKVETFLGDSQHECGPVPTTVGAKLPLAQGEAIAALQLRKNFIDP